MKFDNIDYGRIKTENALMDSFDLDHSSVEDTAKRHIESNLTYRNNKGIIKALSTLRKYGKMDNDSLEIVNKLIGDHKLRKKFVVACDGSYLSCRIWLYIDTRDEGKFNLEIDCPIIDKYEKLSEKFDNMCSKEKINFLYNHFDLIPIQLGRLDMMTTEEELLSMIEFEQVISNLEHDFYFDHYPWDEEE